MYAMKTLSVFLVVLVTGASCIDIPTLAQEKSEGASARFQGEPLQFWISQATAEYLADNKPYQPYLDGRIKQK